MRAYGIAPFVIGADSRWGHRHSNAEAPLGGEHRDKQDFVGTNFYGFSMATAHHKILFERGSPDPCELKVGGFFAS